MKDWLAWLAFGVMVVAPGCRAAQPRPTPQAIVDARGATDEQIVALAPACDEVLPPLTIERAAIDKRLGATEQALGDLQKSTGVMGPIFRILWHIIFWAIVGVTVGISGMKGLTAYATKSVRCWLRTGAVLISGIVAAVVWYMYGQTWLTLGFGAVMVVAIASWLRSAWKSEQADALIAAIQLWRKTPAAERKPFDEAMRDLLSPATTGMISKVKTALGI